MFSKVLIANRGEIAVRIIQTCRELGIATVAVYSEADADALHVRMADHAFCVGPPPALESYLNASALLSVAQVSDAEAVHPGYGFLAENASFARQVEELGLVWIGPPPDVIALMGDKIAAKEIARSAGVPVIPGYYGDDQSAERMMREASVVGFPIMLKAAAGGGGRGMREVHEPAALADALEAARRESMAAFADNRVFLERLVRSPRHIEMQVVSDRLGNAMYLGERDCSIQRRHQKVLEEAPSPIVSSDIRHAMGRDALRLVGASGYTNLGTVEFLFSDDRYYFLEMNTRIQVEHPVTEETTGMDLVRLQLEIAAGEPLTVRQGELSVHGHAIEARIYAEDSEAGFLPSTGTIEAFGPPLGPGLRHDVGVEARSEVTPYYDPMLAKLIVHAPTRAQAIDRLRLALDQYIVTGVTSNLAFLSWIVQQEEFVEGRASTDFIERLWSVRNDMPLPDKALAMAACFELFFPPAVGRAGDSPASVNPWLSRSSWRASGASRSFSFAYRGKVHRVDVAPDPQGVLVMGAFGSSRIFRLDSMSRPSRMIDDAGAVLPLRVTRRATGLDIVIDGNIFALTYVGDEVAEGGAAPDAVGNLTAPMPGKVTKVAVREGQRVERFAPLVVIEAMKMEHVIQAPHEGTVQAVLFKPGDMVPAGAAVVRLGSD